MAQNSSGATPWVAFLVGGLIVVLAIIGYFVYAGGRAPQPQIPENVDVNVNLPKPPPMPDAPKLPDAPVPAPK